MPNAIFDTGVWFAYFVEEDTFHRDAEILVKRLFGRNEKIFLDFIVASYALYWNVEAFYSFDEKLNRAVRRVKPEIVKIKIKRGKVILT